MFAVAAVLAIASVVAYFSVETVGSEANVGDLQIFNLVLGFTLGLALLLAGVGGVHWSRALMTSTEIVEHRGTDDAGDSVQQGAGGGVWGAHCVALTRWPAPGVGTQHGPRGCGC
jgi:ubiquinol-cytochrome c reductase iron-sulfur subunit